MSTHDGSSFRPEKHSQLHSEIEQITGLISVLATGRCWPMGTDCLSAVSEAVGVFWSELVQQQAWEWGAPILFFVVILPFYFYSFSAFFLYRNHPPLLPSSPPSKTQLLFLRLSSSSFLTARYHKNWTCIVLEVAHKLIVPTFFFRISFLITEDSYNCNC